MTGSQMAASQHIPAISKLMMRVRFPSLAPMFQWLVPPALPFHNPAVAHSDNSPPVVRAARLFLRLRDLFHGLLGVPRVGRSKKIAPTAALDVCCGSSRVDFKMMDVSSTRLWTPYGATFETPTRSGSCRCGLA